MLIINGPLSLSHKKETKYQFIESLKVGLLGIDVPNTLCPLCEQKEEDAKRLFLGCHISAQFWSKLGTWWQTSIPCFSRSEDPILWSKFAIKIRLESSWFQVVVIAVLVSIWKMKNGVIFDKKKVDVYREFRNIIELSFCWLSSRNRKFNRELGKWTQSPNSNM